ncbi:uncharacterized protein BJX67DRAFT_106953 [Aspergillus lucknowensis]|uniref:Uncharacterized protein n=1 Tax=Aspergillus lucknowensis TaxID=176173 RepID=A0ABR4LSS7_9EURO
MTLNISLSAVVSGHHRLIMDACWPFFTSSHPDNAPEPGTGVFRLILSALSSALPNTRSRDLKWHSGRIAAFQSQSKTIRAKYLASSSSYLWASFAWLPTDQPSIQLAFSPSKRPSRCPNNLLRTIFLFQRTLGRFLTAHARRISFYFRFERASRCRSSNQPFFLCHRRCQMPDSSHQRFSRQTESLAPKSPAPPSMGAWEDNLEPPGGTRTRKKDRWTRPSQILGSGNTNR